MLAQHVERLNAEAAAAAQQGGGVGGGSGIDGIGGGGGGGGGGGLGSSAHGAAAVAASLGSLMAGIVIDDGRPRSPTHADISDGGSAGDLSFPSASSSAVGSAVSAKVSAAAAASVVGSGCTWCGAWRIGDGGRRTGGGSSVSTGSGGGSGGSGGVGCAAAARSFVPGDRRRLALVSGYCGASALFFWHPFFTWMDAHIGEHGVRAVGSKVGQRNVWQSERAAATFRPL